jgi:hypothetical protein
MTDRDAPAVAPEARPDLAPDDRRARSEAAPRPAEERLLLLLARGGLTHAEEVPARSLLGSDLDWARLLHLARAHEVAPLVCRSLERLGFAGVPDGARAALEQERRANAARNMLLARELARVLGLLDAAAIPAIPLKGVALAESLYGDAALRVCSDMDVLVPRAHVTRAFDLLRADGYRAEFTEGFFRRLLLRSHIEYTLARRAHGLDHVVDLHWGIGWSPRVDRRAAEALWAASRPVARWGVAMRSMPPEWEILTLAVHAARHGCQVLKWLVDVHECCLRAEVDWHEVRVTAGRYGWTRALEETLGLCRALLGTPLPPGFWAPPAREPSLSASPSLRADPLAPLPLLRGPREKLGYLLRLLLVPTLAERRTLSLPSFLGALYYVFRPLRLGGKWGGRALRGGWARLRALSALRVRPARARSG